MKKYNWILSDRSPKETKGSLFYFQLTGLVNGRRQAFVNQPTAKPRLSLWNNT